MNEQVEQLAAKVRNHDSSPYDGEDSQDDVIQSLLEQELARLDDQADLETEASEKRSELREKLGLSDETATDDSEAQDDVAAKQAELRKRMME